MESRWCAHARFPLKLFANKLTCTQVKVEFNTDLLKLDFLVFDQADRAQPRSVWTADIYRKTVPVQTDSAQLKSARTADIYREIFSACAATICRENDLSSSSTNELNSCPFRCVCKTCYFVIVCLNSEIVHQLHISDFFPSNLSELFGTKTSNN